jgi:hypothetical protein
MGATGHETLWEDIGGTRMPRGGLTGGLLGRMSRSVHFPGVEKRAYGLYALIAGRVTGWRAKVATGLLVVAVGLGIWARSEPRNVARGTWDIEPGKGQTMSLEVKKTVDVKVECEATAGVEETYAIYVVDEANEEALRSADSETVEAVASVEGSGAVTLEPTTVVPGKYRVVVENRGDRRVSVKYRVYQMPR